MMALYGPPLTVDLSTMYDVAPALAVHVNPTCELPGIALTPVGAEGAAVQLHELPVHAHTADAPPQLAVIPAFEVVQ